VLWSPTPRDRVVVVQGKPAARRGGAHGRRSLLFVVVFVCRPRGSAGKLSAERCLLVGTHLCSRLLPLAIALLLSKYAGCSAAVCGGAHRRRSGRSERRTLVRWSPTSSTRGSVGRGDVSGRAAGKLGGPISRCRRRVVLASGRRTRAETMIRSAGRL
jgi:hypothetical protein